MLHNSKRILHSLIICLLILLTANKSLAQEIPNGDFEEWLTCLCDPPYWNTNNLYPPPLECIQVSPGFPPYSGDFCIEGMVDSCTELAALFPPLIQSYDIPLNSKPEALHGFYKYFPISDDLFTASIKLYSNNSLIGEGLFKSDQLVTNFSEFIVNIEYYNNDIPDIAIIKFTIDSSLVDNKLHQGSIWYIDYLTFGPLSSLGDDKNAGILTFILSQNYPNPFNPSTKIKFTIPGVETRHASSLQMVTLKVYDVLGNEVATLVNEEKPEGNYEVEFNSRSGNERNLVSGVYFYQLLVSALQSKDGKTGNFIETKKMILLK